MNSNDICKNSENNTVNFIWLELTNACNLSCRHCYANSDPRAGDSDVFSADDYRRIISEAHKDGCRAIQFIGGEPTVNKDLPSYIELSSELGYEFIEVFTNLVRLPDQVLSAIEKYKVHVATSMYSWNPETHDLITNHPGSFFHTLKNIKRVQELNIPLRVGVIEMKENRGQIDKTIDFLKNHNIHRIGVDKMRKFGRADEEKTNDMSELCGNCAGGTICVGSDGSVSPCIMSKRWSIGNLKNQDYSTLIHSEVLKKTRQDIAESTKDKRIDWAKEAGGDIKACNPCAPGQSCNPCPPNTTCPPNNCQPYY